MKVLGACALLWLSVLAVGATTLPNDNDIERGDLDAYPSLALVKKMKAKHFHLEQTSGTEDAKKQHDALKTTSKCVHFDKLQFAESPVPPTFIVSFEGKTIEASNGGRDVFDQIGMDGLRFADGVAEPVYLDLQPWHTLLLKVDVLEKVDSILFHLRGWRNTTEVVRFCEALEGIPAIKVLQTDAQAYLHGDETNFLKGYLEKNGAPKISDGPNDDFFRLQYAFRNTDNVAMHMNIEAGWRALLERGVKAEGVVGVIDTGLENYNSDLYKNLLKRSDRESREERKGLDADKNGCINDQFGCDFSGLHEVPMGVETDHDEYTSHGTAVAGILAAVADNKRDAVGIGGDGHIKVVSTAINFFSIQGLSSVLASLNYLYSRGVGISVNGYGFRHLVPALERAIWIGYDRYNHIYVSAVPNSGRKIQGGEFAEIQRVIEKNATFPSGYSGRPGGLLPNLVNVAGLQSNGQLAGTSAYGRFVQFGAPSVRIPTLAGKFGIQLSSGTSMAAPLVAGVAAFIRGLYPDFGVERVRRIMDASARKFPRADIKYETGTMPDLKRAIEYAECDRQVELAKKACYITDHDSIARKTYRGVRYDLAKELSAECHGAAVQSECLYVTLSSRGFPYCAARVCDVIEGQCHDLAYKLMSQSKKTDPEEKGVHLYTAYYFKQCAHRELLRGGFVVEVPDLFHPTMEQAEYIAKNLATRLVNEAVQWNEILTLDAIQLRADSLRLSYVFSSYHDVIPKIVPDSLTIV